MNIEELELMRVPKAELLPPEEVEAGRRAILRQYEKVVAFGQTIVVSDEETLKEATAAGRLLQAAANDVKAYYAPIKQAHDQAKKLVLEKESADLASFKVVRDSLATQCLFYNNRIEQQRLEQQRLERERAAAAEEERRLAEAIELEKLGLGEEAAARLDEPSLPPPVIVTAAAPKKPAGQVTRTTWRAEVTDLPALVKAVASGRTSISALSANQSWLNRQASDYHEGLQIPGVVVKKEVSAGFRS